MPWCFVLMNSQLQVTGRRSDHDVIVYSFSLSTPESDLMSWGDGWGRQGGGRQEPGCLEEGG